MLPVIADLAVIREAQVAGDDEIALNDVDPLRIESGTDALSGKFAGDRVAISCDGHEAGARYLVHALDVTVERCRHRHQVRSFVFEHFGDAQRAVFRMTERLPQLLAAIEQPEVEFEE